MRTILQSPSYVAGAAVYPYSAKLRSEAQVKSRFGEPYSLARHDPETHTLWLPRAMCPLAGEDRRSKGRKVTFANQFKPRKDEQARVVAEGVVLLRARENFILQAPTGWGKTYVGCALVAAVERRTLVITTKEDIIAQWAKAAHEVLGLSAEDIGVWRGDEEPAEQPFVIGLVQSLMKGPSRYPNVDFQSFGYVLVDECFHPSQELLTVEGWKAVAEITAEDRVAQVDAVTGHLSYSKPEVVIHKPFAGDLVNITGSHCDLLATPNHQHFGYWNAVEPRKVEFAEFKPQSRLHTMYAPNPTEGRGISAEERLLLAFQADGHLLAVNKRAGDYTIRFMFRRPRKIVRMRALLASCGYAYREVVNARGDTAFVFRMSYKPSKRLDWVSAECSGTWYSEALEEIAEWDGWRQEGGGIHYESDAFNAEKVQLIALLAGRVATVWQRRKQFRVTTWPGNVRKSTALQTKPVPYEGSVYCVRMPQGTVLARRNGKVAVTGNCHRMGAEQFSQAMWWFPGVWRMGMTATAYRKDGRDPVFHGHLGPVRLYAHQETMIPRIVVRHSTFKLPRIFRNGEYVKLPHEAGRTGHITKLLARNPARNAMIARFVAAAHRKQRNTIVFSDTLDHLARIHTAVLREGIPEGDIGYYVGITGSQSGAYSGSKVQRIAQRERAKEAPVILATYQMASEATDVPWLDTCVLATPRSDVVQIVGRIRREHPDKPPPVVFDIVDGDSDLFVAYANKRLRWYQSLGCEIRVKS